MCSVRKFQCDSVVVVVRGLAKLRLPGFLAVILLVSHLSSLPLVPHHKIGLMSVSSVQVCCDI